jgi:hypothetical protein
MRAPVFLGGGFAAHCSVGPAGGVGRRLCIWTGGGESPRGHVFSPPPPPKELNASQMQPALECSHVCIRWVPGGSSCTMQTAVEGLSLGCHSCTQCQPRNRCARSNDSRAEQLSKMPHRCSTRTASSYHLRLSSDVEDTAHSHQCHAALSS